MESLGESVPDLEEETPSGDVGEEIEIEEPDETEEMEEIEEMELEELQTSTAHGQDRLAVRIALMCPGPLRTWLLAGGPVMTELKLSFFAGLGAAFLAATMATGIAIVIIYFPGSVAAVHPDHAAEDASTYSNATLSYEAEGDAGYSSALGEAARW